MDLKSCLIEFIEELNNFSYELSVLDREWNILFPDANNSWHHLHVTKNTTTYYIRHQNGNHSYLEFNPKKTVREINPFQSTAHNNDDARPISLDWIPLINSARIWMKKVKYNWIKSNQRIQNDYPLPFRYGVVPHAIVRASIPNIFKLDEELGKEKSNRFIRLVENGFFLNSENFVSTTLTANDFFHYCRIAYLAGKRKGDIVDDQLSGREMYRQYADGRHDGLLDIDPDSENEFSDWIDGKHPGRTHLGHPWEFKRGGNETHIDLSVFRPGPVENRAFKIELRGESISRMAETLRMFLAIQKAGLPISISDPEAVRKRLLAQDTIGIVPSFEPIDYARHHFSKNPDVHDVIHYDSLGRYKSRVAPFIAWEKLPIIKPKEE